MSARQGYIFGTLSYLLWGVLPVYWKLLQTLPAIEILSHRIIWSCAFLCGAVFYLGNWKKVRDVFKDRRSALYALLCAVLIASNWLVYIWGVNHGFALECSLGYFVTPLLNVALGYLLLSEKLRRGQWIAVIFGAAAVVYLGSHSQGFPWIALALALSFTFYGFVRKIAAYGSLEGLTIETIFLTPIALAFVLFAGGGEIIYGDFLTKILLVGAGVVTSAPLLLFASAARRLPLQTIGFLQYLSPTLQFMVAVFVFGEAFTYQSAVGFGLVWVATAIYLGELWWNGRLKQQARTV